VRRVYVLFRDKLPIRPGCASRPRVRLHSAVCQAGLSFGNSPRASVPGAPSYGLIPPLFSPALEVPSGRSDQAWPGS